MAKQLYDYWFVQFDFPNEEGKPYKSSGGKMVWNETLKRDIPEGWDVVPITTILKPSIEKISRNEISITDNYTPIEVIPKNEMSLNETSPLEYATSGLCRYKRKSILMSNRRVYFHKICIAPFDGITRDTVIVLSPINVSTLGYTFMVLNDDTFTEFATRHSYGSEQPVFSWESSNQYYFALPKDNLQIKFSALTNSIIDKVLQNHIQIKDLRSIRDALLPLLMNGQVSIKD